MHVSKANAANSAILGIHALLWAITIIATLYWGQAILIPVALAILLSFLLSRFVTLLDRWFGRVVSVILVVVLLFVGISYLSYVMTVQIVELAVELPNYKTNIEAKLRAVHIPQEGFFTEFTDTIEEIKDEIRPAPREPQTPGTPAAPIHVVESRSELGSALESFFGVFFSVFGTTGFVILLVLFMLLYREDLRGRVVRLIGSGHISAATRALDDASTRVSHYLMMLLTINTLLGVIVAVALYLVGMPNAVLWGGLVIVLRFIPYLGIWIAASLPIVLSVALFPGWMVPLFILSLFVVLEIIVANVVEPLLYGARTGVSPIALVVAAVFWTWLWGPIGLLLSTALTVCLVVMGHHVARLEFLSILLSDEPALTPDEECYHRLLASDENEAMIIVEKYLQAHSLPELYDQVLIPVLVAAETDLRSGLIETGQAEALRQSMGEIVEDLPPPKVAEGEDAGPAVPMQSQRIVCVPVRSDRDELVGLMLSHLLRHQGFVVDRLAANQPTENIIGFVEQAKPAAICISVVPPSTIVQARHLCTLLRARIPGLKIIVGMWGIPQLAPDAVERLKSAGADEVVVSVVEAVKVFNKNSLC